MNVTTKWINECVDRDFTTDELADMLEKAGFPVEEREDLADGDARLDCEITSNRGDCVSVLGLAREAAVMSGRQTVVPDCTVPDELRNDESAPDVTSVENHATDLCPYYSARIIRNVKVGPSPGWLAERMTAIGLRPVNNVVDITNFILFELGQPLHAFDLAKLGEQRIVVRRANPKETITTIDGSKLTLDESMCVIADAKRAVAVAGVMGGLDSEVSDSTTDILLEAASFDAYSVRCASRALKLMSDSSYRFERGVHPATVAPAADRAAKMIAEIAGGTVCKGDVVAGAEVPDPLTVHMRTERCRSLAGADIPSDDMVRYLTGLGLDCTVENEQAMHETIVATIPPYRLDLTREADLIEEIVRMYGFDNLEPRERMSVEVVGLQPEVENQTRVERTLEALGFHEVVTFTFISEAHATPYLPEGFEPLRVGDDRRKAEPILRPSILPSLIACRKRNQDTGAENVKLFEHAACFGIMNGEKLERVNLAIMLDAPDKQVGLREMRAAIEACVKGVLGSRAPLIVRPFDIGWYEKDGSAVLMLGQDVLGTMGVVNAEILDQHDVRTPIVATEIGLPQYYSRAIEPESASAHSPYPSIQRDLSIIVDEEIAWSKAEDAIEQVEAEFLENVEFIGVYRGKQIGNGKKSITIRFTFRSPERTLRHEEVDPQMDALLQRLVKETGATLRE